MLRRPTTILLTAALTASLAAAQTTTRVSVTSAGLQRDGDGFGASVSAEGRYVAFATSAADLVPGDTNGVLDVFIHDRATGATERVSIATDGAQANSDCLGAYVSEDGRFVAFRSAASTLVANDGNEVDDVFLRDRLTGTTTRISVDANGGNSSASSYYPTLSADARYVCFQSEAADLVAGDVNAAFDVFVRDRLLGTTRIVSRASDGSRAPLFEFSVDPAISADGRWVVFASFASNFAAGDANGNLDVFVHDIATGSTELVSVNANGTSAAGASELPSISADGRYVAFVSSANDLVLGDTNDARDVFVRDRVLGTTQRISVGPGGVQASAESYMYYAHPSISADGRFVTFESYAHELVANDANGYIDLFVHDRATGLNQLVSVSTSGQQNHHGGTRATISADGRTIAFESIDGHFVVGDTNLRSDVFVRDLAATCEPIRAHCWAKPNSAGSTPVIGASGIPRLSGPDAFFVTATAVLPHARGLFAWGTATTEVPFHGGVLCIAGPLARTQVQFASASGTYSFHLTQNYMHSRGLVAGTTVYGQWISRDPGFAAPQDVGVTDAIEFTVCP